MANKKRHNKKIYIIGILLIVVIFAINRFSHPKQEDKNLEEQNRTEEEIRDLENENRIAQLQGLEERDRMETYFGMFLQYVENKEYVLNGTSKTKQDIQAHEHQGNGHYCRVDFQHQIVHMHSPRLVSLINKAPQGLID